MIYKYDRLYDEYAFAKCHNGFFFKSKQKVLQFH